MLISASWVLGKEHQTSSIAVKQRKLASKLSLVYTGILVPTSRNDLASFDYWVNWLNFWCATKSRPLTYFAPVLSSSQMHAEVAS